MNARSRQLLLLLLLIAFAAAIHFSGLSGYLTFEGLKNHRSVLEQAVATHYLLSVLLYIVLYILTAFAVPGALILTVAGGFLFHTLAGVIYTIIGATIGGLSAFLLSRYLLGNWLQARCKGQLEQFNGELERNGDLYLVTARLIPILPFFLVNYLCGLTRLPVWTFVWATAAGILPASLVYTFAGTQIGNISSLSDLISPRLVISFLFLSFLALFPVTLKKLRGLRG